MTKPLWAPWRLEYIQQADEQPGCIFCLAAAADDESGLVVQRGRTAFVILNKFPYSSGHLMVSPYRHVPSLEALDDEESLELMRLTRRSLAALREAYRPDGFNVGVNEGKVAGAGVADHLHLHVVPRWEGDTNFMPVTGNARVLSETLADSHRTLAALLV